MDYGWFKICGGLINVSEGVTAVCMSCLVVSHLCLLCLTYCRVDGYQTWGSRLEGAGVLEFGFEFKTNA